MPTKDEQLSGPMWSGRCRRQIESAVESVLGAEHFLVGTQHPDSSDGHFVSMAATFGELRPSVSATQKLAPELEGLTGDLLLG